MESIFARVAELTIIIRESHKDTSVQGAAIWAAAIRERSDLLAEMEAEASSQNPHFLG
jgi:hypothetical protein